MGIDAIVQTLAESMVVVLGGARSLGASVPKSDFEWHGLLGRGLPYRALHATAQSANLSDIELGESIGIPKSTLNRRKHEGRLSVDESDRLYRTARVFAIARTVLDSPENIEAWLVEPNLALGRAMPISLLRTEAGAREVEAVLGRFLFGGYS